MIKIVWARLPKSSKQTTVSAHATSIVLQEFVDSTLVLVLRDRVRIDAPEHVPRTRSRPPFATIAFSQNLHWVERPLMAIALLDLDCRHRAIGTGCPWITFRHLLKRLAAVLEGLREVLFFESPRAVMAGALLDDLHVGGGQ
jgi:hypothetical protein